METAIITSVIYRPEAPCSKEEQTQLAQFLFTHLEQYGDKLEDISKCIDFSMQRNGGLGGFALALYVDEELVGVTIVNKTGMKDYIPENILVYIATHHGYRGQGLGKKLMQEAIAQAEGAIALHVEPDNPARYLYEKLGFTSKYLEMRLSK